jgi:hypothetical protein
MKLDMEILFKDGTKLKLQGYEVSKEYDKSVVYLKIETAESIVVFKDNVSYIHSIPS